MLKLGEQDFLNHIAGIALRNVIVDGDRFLSLNNDPQFMITPSCPMGEGWHEILVDMSGRKITNPKVYFDIGFGISEDYSVRLRLSPETGHYYANVFLPRKVCRLRFDPTENTSDFQLRNFTTERKGHVETALWLVQQFARTAKDDFRHALNRAWQYTKRRGRLGFVQGEAATSAPVGCPYEIWIDTYDYLSVRDKPALIDAIRRLEHKPLISVLMPVYNTPVKLLDEAIMSVRSQVYSNWELCITDDCSTNNLTKARLQQWAKEDNRIKVVYREENGHISNATNSAFEIANGEWVALLDHDDLLRENALAEVVLELNQHPDAQIIYSDEDKIDKDGVRYDPYFKPEFSRELFRSQNYFNHLTVHRAENIRAVGGWRIGYEGSQDYDLNLRIFERIPPETIRHIPKVLYHWRSIEGSTALAGSEKDYAYDAGKRALEGHIQRLNLPATVEEIAGIPFYRMRYSIPDPAPMVSLIIPTKDKIDLLKGCINSILKKTTYHNYEIIVVDNQSIEEDTLLYFKEIKKSKKIRVIHYTKPFNYSAINNFAVDNAKGSIVGLINNDIEVISPEWLTEMVSWAALPEIGCVGAKLYYSNDTIQHAGVIVGLGGVAGHSHKYFPKDHPGYFHRLSVLQNLSAVTAACLLVRKSVYMEVGGLNAKDLTVAFNDVDFCLKVHSQGYANVWTPFAELYHFESISRGVEDNPEKISRFNREIDYMKKTWDHHLQNDPFYSPNLTKAREDFTVSN